MPALPSLFKGRKKAAQAGPSKSAFSYLRGEPSLSVVSPPSSSPRSFAPVDTSEVIDIKERNTKGESLDFDGGKPDEYENDLIDEERREPTPDISASPLVQLDIDLSSPEGLTDWFESKFRNSSAPSIRLGGSSNERAANGLQEGPKLASGVVRARGEGEDASQSASSTDDVLANLQAMDSSHFGQLPGFNNFKRQDNSKHPYKNSPPKPISVPKSQNAQDPPSASKSARSPSETPASSAISGTTLARALLSNTFVLSTDSRLSRYRSGLAGLTRTDSMTLPRAEHSFGGSYDDSFIISPDAPPIPPGADLLYQPPKKSRTGDDQRDQVLKRRSSTGSIHPKALPPTPSSSSRPISALLSPGMEFDLTTFIPTTPEPGVESQHQAGVSGISRIPRSPRSPLPPTPKLAYTVSEDDHSVTREVGPEQYRVVGTQSPSLYSNVTSPGFNMLSPALTSEEPQSAKNLEDVLNYYSIPDSPSPSLQINDVAYRPAFSPISEESSSQLSPPVPYKSDKRESKRNIPVPIGARSPSAGSLRKPNRGESLSVSGPRRLSRQSSLASEPERPQSVIQAPSPTSAHSSASFGSAGSDLLAPPPLSSIFNRARSGSAPSPIKVVRDSKDGTTYKITVGSRADSDTPTSPEEGNAEVTQEFPETPALFSPLLTGEGNTGNASVHMSLIADNLEIPAMPTTPLSATIPRTQSPPNMAQHMLQRGTTISHNRQNSLPKNRPPGGRVRPVSPSTLRIQDKSVESSPRSNGSRLSTIPDSPADVTTASELPQSSENAEEPHAEPSNLSVGSEIQRSPSRGASILTQGSDSSSMYTPSVSESSKSRQKSLPPVPPVPPSPFPPRSSIASSLSISSRPPSLQIPGLDHIPSRVPSPILEAETPSVTDEPSTIPPRSTTPHMSETPPTPSELPIVPPVISSPSVSVVALPTAPVALLTSLPMLRPVSTLHIPLPPTHPPPSPPSPTIQHTARFAQVKTTPQPLTIAQSSSRTEDTVAVNGSETGAFQESREVPVTQQLDNTTFASMPLANTLRPRENLTVTEEGFTGRASDIFRGTSLGSPPPYYVAISDGSTPHNPVHPAVFPGNTNFIFPTHQSQNSLNEAGPSNSTNSVPRTPNLARESSLSMRGRMRPPLPTGPRRPSQTVLGNFSTSQLRDRSGSVSSVNSSHLQHGARARQVSPAASPSFPTPTPRWRGLTMEAAKWTFTSAQLQEIVSRAIRQSAEASSIRLLRLDVLDEELPQELQRLEASRSELKARFKIFTKRRNGLVSGLSMYVTGEEDGSVYAPRMIEELKEANANLDKLTEDLHSLDSQISQLELLVQTHSGSALAMALRKLNASFLKQVSENQTLRDRVQALEGERDEAWHQAENIATEIDSIHGRIDSAPSSKRSSRVSAVKKSSIRVSKAGLRSSGSRFSQLSSATSGVHIYGLTPRSPMPRTATIPPVPPVPRPRPTTIFTDIPMTSPPPLSPDHFDTPTSETRALVAAQEELYAMLGITNPDRTLRRSLSFTMASGTSPSAGAIHTSHIPPMRSPSTPSIFRRASLPGNTMLSDAYQAMAADRNAVLATIDMLSSTD